MLKPFPVPVGGETGAAVPFAVIEIVFILILIAGLVYTWRKGMLEWA
jgi:NADH:ubiquinone oxidoreductase subunit 3 (subunit A)